MKNSTLVIGLTGGIGSGKTTVGNIFESFGAKLIRADEVAKKVIDSDPQIKKKIIKYYGNKIYRSNGKLDRFAMANIIFTDRTKLRKLNDIVHPSVIKIIDNEIRALQHICRYSLVFVEAALIFEADVESMFDFIIVVHATQVHRINRIISRDRIKRVDVKNRFEAQIPQSKKVQNADFIIRNNGDLKSLKKKCKFIFDLLLTSSHIPMRTLR